MPYAPDDRGRPVFLISGMAVHTTNLKSDARASLLVAAAESAAEPLAGARVTVLGEVLPVSANDAAAARELYLARFEPAREWAGFSDFGFYRLEPAEVYYVGGFGVMGWIGAAEYETARQSGA